MRKSKTPLHHKRWTLRMFEWGGLACIMMILVAMFLHKVRHLQAEAERLNVQAAMEHMRTAVLLAGVLPRGGIEEGRRVRAGDNPVAWLKDQTGLDLPHYREEWEKFGPDEIEPGYWYFDCSQRALVYHLRNTAGFESSLTGPARVRFCIRDAADGRIGGATLRLVACEPYRWSRKEMR